MYEMPPSSTNMGELEPSELEIPVCFIIQPIVVEYCKENVVVELINSRIQ